MRCSWQSVAVAGAVLALSAGPAAADGYHGAGTAARSLDEWVNQATQALGLERVSPARSPRGAPAERVTQIGGQGPGDLKASVFRKAPRAGTIVPLQVKAGVSQLVEVVGYMCPGNVLAHEFPDLTPTKIAEYRQAARQMLSAMGSEAFPQVLQAMTEKNVATDNGTPCPEAQRDFLEVLAAQERQARPCDKSIRDSIREALAQISSSTGDTRLRREAAPVLVSGLENQELLDLSKGGSPLIAEAVLVEITERVSAGTLVPEAALGAAIAQRLLGMLDEARHDPERFARLWGVLRAHASTARQASDFVNRLPAAEALRLATSVRDLDLLEFLLSREENMRLLHADKAQSSAVARLLAGRGGDLETHPQLGAFLLRHRNPALRVDDLKKRFAATNTERWERLASLALLAEMLPGTETDWLVQTAAGLPPTVSQLAVDAIQRRLTGASPDALVTCAISGAPNVRPAILKAVEGQMRSKVDERYRKRDKDLVTAFQARGGPEKAALIPVLGKLSTLRSLEALADALREESPVVWKAARDQLTSATGQILGPTDTADLQARGAAAAKWKEWVRSHRQLLPAGAP